MDSIFELTEIWVRVSGRKNGEKWLVLTSHYEISEQIPQELGITTKRTFRPLLIRAKSHVPSEKYTFLTVVQIVGKKPRLTVFK